MKLLSQNKKIRVLVVDDFSLISAGIRSILEGMPGLVVLGEVSTDERNWPSPGFSEPDLIVFNLLRPGLDGLREVGLLLKKFPKVPVILFCLWSSRELVLQALKMGVKGILPRDSKPDELQNAITTVGQDQVYLSSSLPESTAAVGRDFGGQKTVLEQLTPRQRTILKLIGEGKNTKEIAHRLKVSSKTVEFHRARLMSRLSIRDIAGLIRYAIGIGLTHVEE